MIFAFTGLGSQSRMWRATGMRFRELAAVEPKLHAKAFMRANGLLAEHHFDHIRTLIDGGMAECARCGKECQAPEERPDFFAGGFPCQPSSTPRRSNTKRLEPSPTTSSGWCAVWWSTTGSGGHAFSLLETTKGRPRSGCVRWGRAIFVRMDPGAAAAFIPCRLGGLEAAAMDPGAP